MIYSQPCDNLHLDRLTCGLLRRICRARLTDYRANCAVKTMCCHRHEQRETLYNQELFLGILNLSFRITVAFIQSLPLLEILNKSDKQKNRVSGGVNT